MAIPYIMPRKHEGGRFLPRAASQPQRERQRFSVQELHGTHSTSRGRIRTTTSLSSTMRNEYLLTDGNADFATHQFIETVDFPAVRLGPVTRPVVIQVTETKPAT